MIELTLKECERGTGRSHFKKCAAFGTAYGGARLRETAHALIGPHSTTEHAIALPRGIRRSVGGRPHERSGARSIAFRSWAWGGRHEQLIDKCLNVRRRQRSIGV